MALSIQDFATKIKTKYPVYKDMDDYELTSKILKVHPQYESQLEPIKKDFNTGKEPSPLGKRIIDAPKNFVSTLKNQFNPVPGVTLEQRGISASESALSTFQAGQERYNQGTEMAQSKNIDEKVLGRVKQVGGRGQQFLSILSGMTGFIEPEIQAGIAEFKETPEGQKLFGAIKSVTENETFQNVTQSPIGKAIGDLLTDMTFGLAPVGGVLETVSTIKGIKNYPKMNTVKSDVVKGLSEVKAGTQEVKAFAGEVGNELSTLSNKGKPALNKAKEKTTDLLGKAKEKVTPEPGFFDTKKKEWTGEVATEIEAKTLASVDPIAKKAQADTALETAALKRSKENTASLNKEFGKIEEPAGKKLVGDFGTAESVRSSVQKEVIDNVINKFAEIKTKGDVVKNTGRISQLMSGTKTSQHFGKKLKDILIKYTSNEYMRLSDEFAELSLADDLIKRKGDLTNAMVEKLPNYLDDVVSGQTKDGRLNALNKIESQLKEVKDGLQSEKIRLGGEVVDSKALGRELLTELNEQGVNLKVEKLTTTIKRNLEQIKQYKPNDPRVKQLTEDTKILEKAKVTAVERQTAIGMKKMLFDKSGKFNQEKAKTMLSSMDNPAENQLLRKTLSKELQNDILKDRYLTPKKVEEIKASFKKGVWQAIGLSTVGGVGGIGYLLFN